MAVKGLITSYFPGYEPSRLNYKYKYSQTSIIRASVIGIRSFWGQNLVRPTSSSMKYS